MRNVFLASQVKYLDHLIDGEGLHPSTKIRAILDAPSPKNITELKSFLGLLTITASFGVSESLLQWNHKLRFRRNHRMTQFLFQITILPKLILLLKLHLNNSVVRLKSGIHPTVSTPLREEGMLYMETI